MKRALLAAALVAGCSGGPKLTVDSPSANARLGSADDLDPAAPGVQAAVVATTSAADGSLGSASAGDAIAQATVAQGKLRFVVTVPDGNQTLTVSVVERGGRASRVSLPIFADSLRAGCRIVSPADGTVVTADPGDTGLVTIPVTAFCRNFERASTVRLFLDSSTDPIAKVVPDAGGTLTFDATLLPGSNLLTLDTPGHAPQAIRVTLKSQRCRAELSPPSGTLFGAAQDLAPQTAGEQARLVVKSNCPDGTPATLIVTQRGQPRINTLRTLKTGQAAFDVTLPEGPVTAQVFVGPPGAVGASRLVQYAVDSIVPTAAVTSPADGSLVDDAHLVAGQVVFKGHLTGVDPSSVAILAVDEGTSAGGREYLLAPDANGDFQQSAALANGGHVAQVTVTRASGNRGVSARVAFQVVVIGGTVQIVSPVEGAKLGRAKLTPNAAGATAIFQLHTTRLAGGTARVTCGSGASGSAVIPASGDVSVSVDLPLPGCAASAFTCTATGSLFGSATVPGSPLHITADVVAPVVTLVAPADGSSTRQGTIAIHATTSCAAEARTQLYELRNNGVLVSSGAVSNNAIDLGAASVDPGDNRFDLSVSDPAGNVGTATAHVTALQGNPAVVIVAPANGAVLDATSDVDGDLSNGLQALVRVQVANRPAGTQVDLTVSSVDAGNQPRAPLHATLTDGEAAFPAVTLPEGNATLTACVTDPITPPVAPSCASVQVTVSTGRPVCNVVAPGDGDLLPGSSDTRPDLPGYQNDIRVQTGGSGTVTMKLTDPAGAVSSYALPAPAGTGLRIATFSSITFGSDGLYRLDATCAAASGRAGLALTNQATLQTSGPVVTFVSPVNGAAFNAASPDTSTAAGFQTDVAVRTTAGAAVTLLVQCQKGAQASYGPVTASASGAATLAGVTLLNPDGGDDTCVLKAQATQAGAQGLPTQITVTIDRSIPAPLLTSPPPGASYDSTSVELDCTSPSSPVLKLAAVSVADPVPASGLTLYVNGGASSVPAVAASGGFTFANIAIANGDNTLAVAAVDAAGNRGTTQQGFVARCTGAQVGLSLVASGTKLGWAQDKDHTVPGEQIGVQVTATVPDGTKVRICSTLGDASQSPCETAGSYPLPAGSTISGGLATFDETFPDGAQTIVAEVIGSALAPSAPKSIVVRADPPVVSAIAIVENDADLSLNAAEQQPTLHFTVTATGAIAGLPLEIHSTSLGTTVLGTATAVSGVTTVAVPLSAVAGAGGYQQHVFYAFVRDDAGNPNSIPGAEYPGVPATTLGTAAQPFVIAPLPSATLDRPSAAKLLAADDTRCAPSCPGTDPLSYGLSATTSAPAGSTAVFLVNGAQAGSAITTSGATIAATALLANGPAQALAVRVTDPYGNVVTSAARTVLIDSVPPALTLTPPATISTVPATVPVATGTTLEAGQTITVTSDLDGVVGSGACASSGTTQVSISLKTNGQHKLTASASDAAGNPGTSAAATTIFVYSGPTIALTQPTPSSSKIVFGTGTASGGRCAPALQAGTTRATDGTPVIMWVAPSADCSGAPSSQKAQAPATSGTATFTGALTFADAQSGFLCAQVTVGPRTATTSPQAFGCDLSTPQVAWATPASGQLYVAPPLGGRAAIASQGADPLTLIADFSLTATARAGSTVTLADGAAAPFATQTLATDCTGCTLSFPAAHLAVAPGGALGHSLVATVTSPGGSGATATRPVQIDINPPSDAAPVVTVTQRLGGVLHVAIAQVPGDDGSAGGTVAAYQVRWSLTTALTTANWANTGTLLASALVPAPAAPGAAQSFDVTLPADAQSVWLGVRAVDRAGNLGAFTDQSTATASLLLSRVDPIPAAGIPLSNANPDKSTNANNLAARMRVADLDGDGFDDVILSYPNDGTCSGGLCDGRIYIYFGGAGGFANASAPMVLSTPIAIGALGLGSGAGLGFDVGDFDGDGKADVVASATDCFSAEVDLYKGSAIAAARASSGTPAKVVLKDGSNLIGGTVRAVAHVTGGSAAGDDLLLSNYTAGCGTSTPFSLHVLPRGGAWLAGTASALSFAQSVVTLPAGHTLGTANASALDVLESGTTRQSLFVTFLDTSTTPPLSELRTIAGSALGGAPVALTSGVALAAPSAGGGGTNFGLFLDSSQDATGDGKKDLAVSGDKRVFLYDSTTLLTAGAQPATTLDVTTDNVASAEVAFCAQLLPDLNGDGIGELSGCANIGSAPQAYFAFGGSGPALSYFPTPFAFLPQRGQRIAGKKTAFGQKIGAGHVTSKTGLDLVVLSETGTTGGEFLELLR